MKKSMCLLLALVCLVGCSPVQDQPKPSGSSYGLWFAADTAADKEHEDHPFAVEFEPRAWEAVPPVGILLDALLAGPESADMASPFPSGVEVRSVQLDHGTSTILVDLSEQYASLSGFDLTVADYCITKTLCQISGVETVRILVEGEPLPYRNRQDLQEDDLMLTDVVQTPGSFLAVLYFPDWDSRSLCVEYRQVERYSDNAAEIVMTELLRGPVERAADPAIPEGTQILGLSVTGSVCQVDLSREYVDNVPQTEGGPALTLYSLVNSLCALGGVTQVRLLVEGSDLQNYHGIAVGTPISANFDLLGN